MNRDDTRVAVSAGIMFASLIAVGVTNSLLLGVPAMLALFYIFVLV